MSPKNSDEMPAEFPLRPGGGVRGKHFERYTQGVTVKLVFDATALLHFVASSTSAAAVPTIGAITRTTLSPMTAQIKWGDGAQLESGHAR